jgi:quinone-modifying oxidoreductase subunit QmoA
MNNDIKHILVIGGGIAGITAALEAAEVGYKVILVEKEPYLGGRVMRMYRYFPKMFPPACGFEINTRRIRQNARIKVHTSATVESIEGTAGEYFVKIRIKPRYVTGTKPIDESMAEQLSSERPNDFNYGLDKTKALYMPHDMAYPSTYMLDREALSDNDANKLLRIAPEGAVDLEMTDKVTSAEVAAIIIATGWHPYDATKLDNLGFGSFPNVITNVMMERLASSSGPTGGQILRPSDNKPAENIAFVQCAGSRDDNHLPYCSAVCCMASLKQIRYTREKNENAKATMFYIDIRAVGRHEKFYYSLLDDNSISFIKGKVASISEDENHNLILDVEDTLSRETLHQGFDLVVLATGMVPNTEGLKFPFELNYDRYGFISGNGNSKGIYAAGCARHPCDVSRATKDSTSAALRAIQCLKGGE